MNVCEAGHKKHSRIVTSTDIGAMTVFDTEKYMGFKGYCTGQDDVSRSISITHRWEPLETEVAWKILEKGNRENLFVDIGAHIGWFSRVANALGYKSIAYEADKENIELFNLNVENADMYHVWVDEQFQLPNVIDKDIELLKIDIEGNEKWAINAFEKYLDKIHNILMEVSPTFNDSYPALVQRLVDSGFKVYNIDMSPFNFKYDFHQTNLLFRREE